jgi:hypothetical protein
MAKRSGQKGSVLILVIVSTVVMVAVAFFALNYVGLFAVHKRAQSAVDAAALQAAKDIASITVNTSSSGGPSVVGPIALIDIPAGAKNHPGQAGGVPPTALIRGFNTAVAVARLDMLIAKDIENPYIPGLVRRDVTELEKVAQQLNKRIAAAVAPNGQIAKNVRKIFIDNYPKLNGGVPVDPASVKLEIRVGGVKAEDASTNVPIAAGEDGLRLNGGARGDGTYVPYKNIAVDPLPFAFTATADQPKLVDHKSFIAGNPSVPGFGIVPTSVVEVRVKFRTRAVAPDSSGTQPETTLENVACAQAGAPLGVNPGTVYQVGFAGGFPPTKSNNGPFDRITVADIAKAPSTVWRPVQNQSAVWLRADPTNTTGSPATSPPGNFQASSFPGAPSSLAENHPSVSLSFGVYDWLKSLGLRAHRQSASNALREDLIGLAKNSTLIKVGMVPGDLMQPAWAQAMEVPLATDEQTAPEPATSEEQDETGEDDLGTDFSVQTSAFSEEPNAAGLDPRYSAILNETSTEGKEFLNDAFGYKSLKELAPEETMSLLVNPITGATSPGGNDIGELCRLVEGLIATSRAGCVSRYGGIQATIDGRKLTKDSRIQEELFTQQIKEAVNRYADLQDRRDMHLENTSQQLTDEASRIQAFAVELDKAIVEKHRSRFIRRRAIRSRYNGIFAHNRSVRTIKRLKKWTARGIKEIHYKGPGSSSSTSGYDGAAYVCNIKGAPRLVEIMPNTIVCNPKDGKAIDNMSLIRDPEKFRSGQFRKDPEEPDTTENIYNIRPYTEADITVFRDAVMMVDPLVNRDVRRTIADNVSLPDGHIISVSIPVLRTELQLAPKDSFVGAPIRTGNSAYPEFRKPADDEYRWETGAHGKEAESGRYVLKRYTNRLAGNNFVALGELRNKFDEAVKRAQQLAYVPSPRGDEWLCQPALAEDIEPPNFNKLFLMRCVGDALKGDGKIEVRYLKDTIDSPFAQQKVLAGQYLYFASNAFAQGADNPVMRSVVARDQQVDGSVGNSYLPQDANSYCKQKGSNFDFGQEKLDCPVQSGEWRLGPPIAIGCCKLNPDKKQLFHKPVRRRNVVTDARDDDAANLDEDALPGFSLDESLEGREHICPKIPKRFG